MAGSERRCHYEVLGLRLDCGADEIRPAYKKLALQLHPDKLVRSGLSGAEATAKFQELSHAYEVLSDPKERAWYDSHRSKILFADPTATKDSSVPDLFSFFSNSAFSGYSSDSKRSFFRVYSEVFGRVYANELEFARKMGLGLDAVREAPAMGDLESPYTQASAFYSYWTGFSTVMEFFWADVYDSAAGLNRKSRRVMEEENAKARRKARREYNETVRGLAEFAKKRDKRVIDMAVRKREEEEKRKAEMKERRMKEERERIQRAMAYREPEWAQNDDVDDADVVEEEEENEEELYCVACGKKFKSDKQWKNHERSKKHKDKVAQIRREMLQDDVDDDDVDDDDDDDDDDVAFEELSEAMRGAVRIEEEREEKEEEEGREENDEDGKVEGKDGNGVSEDETEEKEEEEEEEEEGREENEEGGKVEGKNENGVSKDESKEKEEEREENGSGKVEGKDENGVLEEDIGDLEAMLGGRRNKKKPVWKVEENEEMEYNNRKITRKSRRAKKGKNESNGNDERDADPVQERRVDEKGTAKSKSRGKKSKASSSRNVEHMCEKCGEDFESKNKLYKHLSDTGHATIKQR